MASSRLSPKIRSADPDFPALEFEGCMSVGMWNSTLGCGHGLFDTTSGAEGVTLAYEFVQSDASYRPRVRAKCPAGASEPPACIIGELRDILRRSRADKFRAILRYG